MEKYILSFILLFNSTVIFASFASIKVIYGEDDRQDVENVLNPEFQKLAESTAAMITKSTLIELNAEQIKIAGRSLEETGVCSSERFSNQPAAANCSGFLVAKDTLVTAGHCVKSQFDCDKSAWVFDYKVEYSSDTEVIVEKSSVYNCKEIVSQSLDSATQNDYAVIKLEKSVEDREPLKFRDSGAPEVGDELVVIGHPSGLPTKVADNAVVRSVNDVFMVTSLDTYGGNSGSAVFNVSTGVVEGILVRGDTDYIWDRFKGCKVSNQIPAHAGRGEDVTLMSAVKGLPEQVEEPVEEPVQEDPEEEEPVEDDPVEEVPSWWLRFLEWLNARN